MKISKYPSFIQFIGTQRSGSNLLRVMLNQLPEVSAPHPPHLLKTFFPLQENYGDLTIDANFYSLVKDMCEWVNLNPVPWEGLVLNAEDIAVKCTERSIVEIFVRIYEEKARVDNARYCCCKSMESVNYFTELEQSGLKPFYLHIFRDGRDVALSFMKAIVGPKHIFFLAKKWKEEQELSLQIKSEVPPGRFISVKYEELIHKPYEVMKGICDKLNVHFTEDIFEYFHSVESLNTARSGRMWKNLAQPIMANNHDKFKKELTAEQLYLFEAIAGNMLIKLGYEVINENPELPQLTNEQIEIFRQEDRSLAKTVLVNSDADEVKRREPQDRLLQKIMNYKSLVL